jgi:hypothetical protein
MNGPPRGYPNGVASAGERVGPQGSRGKWHARDRPGTTQPRLGLPLVACAWSQGSPAVAGQPWARGLNPVGIAGWWMVGSEPPKLAFRSADGSGRSHTGHWRSKHVDRTTDFVDDTLVGRDDPGGTWTPVPSACFRPRASPSESRLQAAVAASFSERGADRSRRERGHGLSPVPNPPNRPPGRRRGAGAGRIGDGAEATGFARRRAPSGAEAPEMTAA